MATFEQKQRELEDGNQRIVWDALGRALEKAGLDLQACAAMGQIHWALQVAEDTGERLKKFVEANKPEVRTDG